MSRFILVHRVIKDGEVPMWLNQRCIRAMEATHGGDRTKLYLGRDGCCEVSENPGAMLDAIRRANDDG